MSAPPSTAFRGLWIPLVTPFRDGAIDHDALAALTRSLAHRGIAGFVVCGSTGEAAALDEAEQLSCLRTVAAHCGPLPLVMGLSDYHLGQACARVRQWSDLARADIPALSGLLVSAPHYVRPSQEGVRRWFETLADASALPLMVYDIPYRTGVTLSLQTLLALAAHPNIRAVKDCGGELGKTLALIDDGRLSILAGEDLQIFSLMAQGAAGAIAASAHLHTGRYVQMMQALADGELGRARALWAQLAPLIEALFAEPNPAPLKACLAREGAMREELRAPMAPISAGLKERLMPML